MSMTYVIVCAISAKAHRRDLAISPRAVRMSQCHGSLGCACVEAAWPGGAIHISGTLTSNARL